MQQLPPWVSTMVSAATGGGVVLAFVLGMQAWAENTELDSGPRTIPYNGYLEFNGQTFTGPADLRFTLTDDGECTFTEDHEDVPVFAGQFSVGLGTVEGDLPGCLFNAQRVFLQMAVRGGNDNTDHVALAGRQRINPVPFAYWSAEGSNFKVDGDANITGNVNAVAGNFTGNIVSTGRVITNNGNGAKRLEALSLDGSLTDARIFSAGVADWRLGTGAGLGSRLRIQEGDNNRVADFFRDGIQLAKNTLVEGEFYVGGSKVDIGADNVRPPSGSPRLRLRQNIADGLDNKNDYQLILYEGGSALDSYGIGIQNATMFFNAASGAQHRFYINGTEAMTVRADTSNINSTLRVGGGLEVSGARVKLPIHAHPPHVCEGQSGDRGSVYIDIEEARNGFGFETLCLCTVENGVFRWVRMDNASLTCN